MKNVPSRVADRLTKGLKRFQPILTASRARDDGEADTVMIVIDMYPSGFSANDIKHTKEHSEFLRSRF
jgi:hypothetical protein